MKNILKNACVCKSLEYEVGTQIMYFVEKSRAHTDMTYLQFFVEASDVKSKSSQLSERKNHHSNK